MAKKIAKSGKQSGTSKSTQIITLLMRPSGASVPEIMKATSWQAHSVRGFMSGTLKAKQGLLVVSNQTAGKDRRYRIADAS